jgi:iron complex outermembrane receptor protein
MQKISKITRLTGLLFLPLLLHAQQPGLSNFPDTINLKEVTISANLPLNNRDVLDYYRTNHFATIDNITARLDGMSLIRRGAYAMEPMLHGFSGGQLNVTIDGMKIFGACTDKMDPVTSYIEPTNLKSISIKQGTSGSMNGCNIGGSLDMTLQEPDIKNSQPEFTSLGMGYESVSQGRNILFSTGFSNKKWAWGIDGVYRKNENYRDGKNRVIPFSQFEKTNIHTVLRYSIDAISHLKADLLYDLGRNIGYPALPMDVSKARANIGALEYDRNGKTRLKAKIYYNQVLHIMDDSKRDSTFLLTNSTSGKKDTVYMRMDMPGKTSTFGSYLQAERSWNTRNRLLVKLDNYANHSLAEMTMHMNRRGTGPEPPMYMQTWPEMLRIVTGLYLQNTTAVSENFRLTINGRVDYGTDILKSKFGQQQFSVFGYSLAKKQSRLVKSLNLSPEIDFGKNFSMNATLGYSERLPTITERLGFYLYNAYDGYDYIGNPYIKTEKSDFAQLAFRLTKPGLKINLSQTFSYVTDYIMGITDPVIPPMNFYTHGTRVYSNLPSAKLYSADLELMYFPVKHFSLFELSKFTYGELGSGEPLPLMPPLKNIVSVKYQKDRFSIQFENESSLAQNRINTSYGETASRAYSLFHAKGSYSIPLHRVSMDIGVGVSNIFNRAYYDHLDWGRINRPGRNAELFLKFSV